ncbi:MAG TPA: hypothetical protein VMW27_15925 [Thermoanaerobaculia bacterium]|nr:hypothetical protein [Thermoanaerobaculia bacterium]
MAVVDTRPGSPRYGQVISSVPAKVKGSMPHHLEYELPGPGRWLFGNGHHTERILLFDLSEPERPRTHRVLGPVPPFRFPHDFARLPNGNVLVGFLRSNGPSPLAGDTLVPGGHGGIAELDPEGRVLRKSSAAAPGLTAPVRIYSFAVMPDIDRLLTTSAPMLEPFSADVVQVWRLSDLKLLATLETPPARLPNGELLQTRSRDGKLRPTGHRMPFEPRVMPDGSVLLNAYGCGLYRVTALASDTPAIANVYTIAVPAELRIGGCSIPVVIGRFWLMPVANAHKIVVLDIRDPAHPFEVASLASDPDFFPHWLAKDPGDDRLIVGQEMGYEHRMLMLRVDPATGRIGWDQSIRSPDGSLGISFRRRDWPHGATGDALGHAALFRP